jgi:hypothetical protein
MHVIKQRFAQAFTEFLVVDAGFIFKPNIVMGKSNFFLVGNNAKIAGV